MYLNTLRGDQQASTRSTAAEQACGHAYLYVCVHCLPGVRRCLNLVILSPAACLRHRHFQDGGAAVRRSCSLMDGCSCMGAYRLRYLRQIMLQQCSSVAKKAC